MFTGLIEEIGTVRSIRTGHGRAELRLAAPHVAPGTHIGDSIAVNGCCLTVTSVQDEELSFDLLEETISRTNLGTLKRGSAVNLERPLAAGSRLGGHFVQGHVDCAAAITSRSVPQLWKANFSSSRAISGSVDVVVSLT